MSRKSDSFKYSDGVPRKLRPPSERFLKAVEAVFGHKKYTVGNPPKKENKDSDINT